MLEYIPEYGMIFDTISSLMLLCNPEETAQVKTDTGLCNENIQWIYDNLQAPGEMMNLFFTVRSDKSRSFMQYLFCTNQIPVKECSFDVFCDTLLVKDQLLSSLMEYYFSSICWDCESSDIRKMILNSDYESPLKMHILGVFCETDYYLEELLSCLRTTYNKVAYYYKTNLHLLTEVQNQISDEVLYDIEKKLHANTQYGTLYYSIAMLSQSSLVRRGLGFVNDKENVVFILGPYWKERLQKYSEETEINLVAFGKLLSEENRYRIIQYLLANREITIAKAMDLLDTSLTATNYHLNLMASEKMLLLRNEGRKLFFSLNREYFEKATNEIHSLTEQIK